MFVPFNTRQTLRGVGVDVLDNIHDVVAHAWVAVRLGNGRDALLLGEPAKLIIQRHLLGRRRSAERHLASRDLLQDFLGNLDVFVFLHDAVLSLAAITADAWSRLRFQQPTNPMADQLFS